MKNEQSSKPIEVIGLPTASGSAEFALRQMRNFIEHGHFETEGRLPPERELAAQLRVGRSTLRKALEILEAEGEIWRHVGQGTFVGRRSSKLQVETSAEFEQGVAARIARRAARTRTGHRRKCCRHRAAIGYRLYEDVPRKNAKTPSCPKPIIFGITSFISRSPKPPGIPSWWRLLEQLNGLRRAPTWTSYKKDRMKEPHYSASKREHREIIAAIEAHDSDRAVLRDEKPLIGRARGLLGLVGRCPESTPRNDAD